MRNKSDTRGNYTSAKNTELEELFKQIDHLKGDDKKQRRLELESLIIDHPQLPNHLQVKAARQELKNFPVFKGYYSEEELASDVHDKLREKVGNFRGESRFPTYLRKITYHTLIDRFRSSRREIDAGASPNPLISDGGKSVKVLDTQIYLKEIEAGLSERELTIIRLLYKGYSVTEISEMTDLTQNQVYQSIYRLRQRISQN